MIDPATRPSPIDTKRVTHQNRLPHVDGQHAALSLSSRQGTRRVVFGCMWFEPRHRITTTRTGYQKEHPPPPLPRILHCQTRLKNLGESPTEVVHVVDGEKGEGGFSLLDMADVSTNPHPPRPPSIRRTMYVPSITVLVTPLPCPRGRACLSVQ